MSQEIQENQQLFCSEFPDDALLLGHTKTVLIDQKQIMNLWIFGCLLPDIFGPLPCQCVLV